MFALAVVLRAATAFTYWPGLVFTDSWSYLKLALTGWPIAFQDDRPSGYPLIIRILMKPTKDIEVVTTFQHIAGLTVGVLVYLLLLRLGVRRWVATVAAALVLLDGYLLAGEQFITAEPLFALALTLAIYLLVVGRDNLYAIVASGVLVGVAATVRTVGLVAVPVWIVYVLWTRRRLVPVVAVVTALAVPLAAYATLHAAKAGGFGITGADGWFLYSRIGAIASCRGVHVPPGTEPLCNDPGTHDRGPEWYAWEPDSPAHRLFPNEAPWKARTSNGKLRAFALAVIRARPASYLRVVAHDFFGYLSPTYGRVLWQDTVELPKPGGAHELQPWEQEYRRLLIPGYSPDIRRPAGFLHDYARWAHVPRWLLDASILAAAAMLTMRRREAMSSVRYHAVALLLVTSLAMLLATAMFNGFRLRLLLPEAPLLIAAGAIALEREAVINEALSGAPRRPAPTGRP